MNKKSKKIITDLRKFHEMPKPFCMIALDWNDILKKLRELKIPEKEITRTKVLDIMGKVSEEDASELYEKVESMIEDAITNKEDEEE